MVPSHDRVRVAAAANAAPPTLLAFAVRCRAYWCACREQYESLSSETVARQRSDESIWRVENRGCA